MPNHKALSGKLTDISRVISEKYREEQQLGVLSGISGMALFQFYYAKFLDNDAPAASGAEILEYAIERVNNGYNLPTYCTGLAGFGWTVTHLEQHDFIDVGADELLSPLDPWLYSVMTTNLKDGNYDFLHGALGYGYYFLKRYRHTLSKDLKNQYKGYLLDLVAGLEKLSEKEGDALRWESVLLVETGERGYNLSLSHGMASIAGFLARLCAHGDFKEQARPLLYGALSYIRSFIKQDTPSQFPNWIKKDEPPAWHGRVAWCYGDPGAALVFLKAAEVLQDQELKDLAIDTMKHNAARTRPDDTLVQDAGFCHGSYGNAQLFDRMYRASGEKTFRKAADFWMADGLEKAVHPDGYAGYKQWLGSKQQWERELSILEGVAGIGLSIISHLSGKHHEWEECFMIG